jgi:hypothetical protein
MKRFKMKDSRRKIQDLEPDYSQAFSKKGL